MNKINCLLRTISRFKKWWRPRQATRTEWAWVSIAYKLSWEREYLDLTELARLRWIEHWKIERLAAYFTVSPTAIKERLRALKKCSIDIG